MVAVFTEKKEFFPTQSMKQQELLTDSTTIVMSWDKLSFSQH